MSTFAERLEKLVGGNRRQTAFSRETGVPVSTLRDYLKGSVPNLDRVVQIARAKDISLLWLATGEGAPENADLRREAAGQLIGQSNDFPVPPEGYVAIPRLNVRASAGTGRIAGPEDLNASSAIALRAAWLRTLGVSPEHAQFLVADGDSMKETILHGDLLLINRQIDRVITNAIYVLVLDGGVMVKRLQRLRDGSIMLISDNPLYQPERVNKSEVSNLQIEGKVHWYGRAI